MPEEIMVVFIVFFLFVVLPLGLTKMILGHKRRNMELERGPSEVDSGTSLTEKELRNMIKASVVEANIDINKRLDLIQEELDEVVHDKLRLDSEAAAEEKAPKSVGRRVR